MADDNRRAEAGSGSFVEDHAQLARELGISVDELVKLMGKARSYRSQPTYNVTTEETVRRLKVTE